MKELAWVRFSNNHALMEQSKENIRKFISDLISEVEEALGEDRKICRCLCDKNRVNMGWNERKSHFEDALNNKE